MQQPAAAGVSTEPDGARAPPHTAALPQTQTRSASQSRSAWTSSDADLPKGQEISTNSTLAFGTSKEGTTSNLIMTTKKPQQHQGFIMAEWFPLFSLFFFLRTSVFQHHKVLYTFITGTLNKYYLVDLVLFETKLWSNTLLASTENIFTYDWGHSLVVNMEVLG